MKKVFLLLVVSSLSMVTFAQAQQDGPEEVKTGGFKKEKMFTGGDLTLSFYTGGTTLGVSPYLGYSITKWLDAAVKFNFLYQSQSNYDNTIKYRQTNYGPGAFVRLFPINFLFVQAQYEHNFISSKIIQSGTSSFKNKSDVNSLLLGIGYSSGRSEGNNTYFYFSLMYDVLKLPNSPYVDYSGRLVPVISAGYNIGLFQGGGGGGERRRQRNGRD